MPRATRILRSLPRAAVFVAIGAMMTVVVTLTCCPLVNAPGRPLPPLPLCWPVAVPPDWPAKPDLASPGQRVIGLDVFLLESREFVQRAEPGGVRFFSVDVVCFREGLPLRCFERRYRDENTMWAPSAAARVRRNHDTPDEWPVRLPGFGVVRIPTRPLWPGFVLDTLFYAVLAWGAWWGGWQISLALRRRSRRRKGKCVHCGYDLTATPAGSPCPECGRTQ